LPSAIRADCAAAAMTDRDAECALGRNTPNNSSMVATSQIVWPGSAARPRISARPPAHLRTSAPLSHSSAACR
jgi:hypothetical protein